jgi:hypothetical protein
MFERLHIPASKNLKTIATEAIRLNAVECNVTEEGSTALIEQAARDAQMHGDTVNAFWFEDCKYKPRHLIHQSGVESGNTSVAQDGEARKNRIVEHLEFCSRELKSKSAGVSGLQAIAEELGAAAETIRKSESACNDFDLEADLTKMEERMVHVLEGATAQEKIAEIQKEARADANKRRAQMKTKDLEDVELRQILQGRKADSADLVDMTAERETLTVLVTGRSIEVPIKAEQRGSFSIPIGVLFKMRKIGGTYKDARLRIRISEGKIRLQGMTTSHPGIKAKLIARRVIDVPDDATTRDILSLPFIFSTDEIEDSGLSSKLLDAQKRLAESLTSAHGSLSEYGFDRNELSAMVTARIKTHAATMRRVMLGAGESLSKPPSVGETSPATRWLDLGFRLWEQEKWSEVYRCFLAALAEEPDNSTVMYWLGHLCEKTDEIANRTGMAYEDMPFAFDDGVEFLRKAAHLGHAEAQYRYAQKLLKCGYEQNGELNAQEIAEGLGWLRKSAAQANGHAALTLARRYLLGHGVETDLGESLFWFEQAEAAGLCNVEEVLEGLRRERRMERCKRAAESGDRVAFLYAEWADRSPLEFSVDWSPEMFSEDMMDSYRREFPDRKLGESPWWEVPPEFASRSRRNHF